VKTFLHKLTVAFATAPVFLGAGTATATEIADIAISGLPFQTLSINVNDAGRLKHCGMPTADLSRQSSNSNARNFTPMKIAIRAHPSFRGEAKLLTRVRWQFGHYMYKEPQGGPAGSR